MSVVGFFGNLVKNGSLPKSIASLQMYAARVAHGSFSKNCK
jgi:hypothetical protein